MKADGRWHEAAVELDSAFLSDARRRANMMLVYAKLGVPEDGESNFDVDALRVME